MKKVTLFTFFCFTILLARSQNYAANMFFDVVSCAPKKVNSYIVKKGFRAVERNFIHDTIVNVWQQVVTLDTVEGNQSLRRLYKYAIGKELLFELRTPVKEEFNSIVSTLQKEGFRTGTGKNKNDSSSFLFQKKNLRVETFSYTEDSLTFYSILHTEKVMPPARSVTYAEHLLHFSSHEYLVSYFGEKNVKGDLYYFSESEINKCTILFPNTPRQAVFIWKDEENLNELSYIVIGGAPATGTAIDKDRQMIRNEWVSQKGLYVNMRIEQLMQLNGEDFSFFGYASESFLTVKPEKGGKVDFTTTGIVLDCLNCNGASFLDKPYIKASEAIDNNMRLHIGMIILLPQGREPQDRLASR